MRHRTAQELSLSGMYTPRKCQVGEEGVRVGVEWKTKPTTEMTFCHQTRKGGGGGVPCGACTRLP